MSSSASSRRECELYNATSMVVVARRSWMLILASIPVTVTVLVPGATKDRETGTRWTLAGRDVDGRLRGKELKWVDSIQCRWYAWSAVFPKTLLYHKPK